MRRGVRTGGWIAVVLAILCLGLAKAGGATTTQSQFAVRTGTGRCATLSTEPTPTSCPVSDGAVVASDVVLRLDVLEQRVADSQALLETQRAVFTATVNRMESNFSLLIAIIAIAGLAAALLGVRLVREMVQRAVEARLLTITEERLTQAIDDEVARLRSHNEERFGALYDEYKEVVERAKR